MNRTHTPFLWGFIPSLILPLLFMVVFIHFNYHGTYNIGYIIKELFRINQLSGLLAVGSFPNLFLFLYAMHKENWRLGRGVIAATLFYGIIIMIMKFL